MFVSKKRHDEALDMIDYLNAEVATLELLLNTATNQLAKLDKPKKTTAKKPVAKKKAATK